VNQVRRLEKLVITLVISAVLIILPSCKKQTEQFGVKGYKDWSDCVTRISEIEERLSESMFGSDTLTRLKVEKELDEALCNLASITPPPELKRKHYAILKLGVLTLAIMQLNRKGYRVAVVSDIALLNRWLEEEKFRAQLDAFKVLDEVSRE